MVKLFQLFNFEAVLKAMLVSFITSKKNLKKHSFVEKETKFEEDGSIIHMEKKVSRSGKTDSRMVFTQDVEGNMKYVINIHTVECQI